ncbi:MAG: glycosyltransferase family 9 protein [Streptosporangiales bacterium]|nr:glycosyltransferase family 9 protein [Streptosporangiales bacterium]
MAVTSTAMPTVVMLRALGLGDLLTAVPALRAVRRAYPLHRLVLAAPRPLGELMPLTGAADELLETPGPSDFRWPGPPPDAAVNLHGRGPQSVAALLAARPGRLLSHACPDFPEVRGPRWQDGEHEVRRWCHLLRWFGLAADPRDLLLRRPPGKPYAPGAVIVHPGAAHPDRRWRPQDFAAVARALTADGHHVEITGGLAERGLAEKVARAAGLPGHAGSAGRLGLCGLAALVASARLVICGDTGVGHLAAAYGRPSVHLFGPVPPRLWGPPPRRRHRVLWTGRPGRRGLEDITVPAVLQEARELLANPPPAPVDTGIRRVPVVPVDR